MKLRFVSHGFSQPAVFDHLLQVVGEFIKMGIDIDAATAGTAVQKIVGLLTDAELPVRIFATTSLAAVLDDENVQLLLKPHVNILLNSLFTIIQQVISEETMSTLATIIESVNASLFTPISSCFLFRFCLIYFPRRFPDETRPHSVMLIQGLVPMWGRLVDASVSADDDDEAVLCMWVHALICSRRFVAAAFVV
jgi:hypothetical protein